MSINSELRTRGVIAFVCCLFLAACSQSGYEPGTISGTQTDSAKKTTKPVLYVQLLHGYNQLGEVLAYHPQRNGKFAKSQPFCDIENLGFATGIATDAEGNLYVDYSTPNSTGFGGAPYYIDVYKPDCGSKVAQISDPYLTAGDPRQIAFGKGVFYVADQYGDGGGDSANVAVCSLRKKKCTGKIAGSGSTTFGAIYGVAVDGTGNVYADGYLSSPSGQPAIAEWPSGRGAGRIIAEPYGTGSNEFAGPMEFDNQGNLVVGSAAQDLYVFTGCPSACVQTTFSLKSPETVDFVLSPDNSTLYAVSEVDTVDVYSYRGINGITYKYSLTNGLAKGSYPYSIALHQ
jgi:hypothetical protein